MSQPRARKVSTESGRPSEALTQDPLAGSVALVTGGTRGIGAAIARSLEGAGATLAVNYRSDDGRARQLADDLPRGASLWKADVSDAVACSRMVHGVLEKHGGLDILIVNAGVWRGGAIGNLGIEDWRTVLATSLDGAYNTIAPAVPAMQTSGFGRIVVISSVIGITGFPGDVAYSSAKAGLFGLVRSLAKELGDDGITVNAVAPGLIDTEMIGDIPERGRQFMLRRTAIRRLGTPDEVADGVLYLVCSGAYVTGQTLVIDGGYSL